MTTLHIAQNMSKSDHLRGAYRDTMTFEQRQQEYDEMIHTLHYGPMPDFITAPSSWLFEAGERTKAILKKLGVHPSEAYRIAEGWKRWAKDEKCFDLYVIFDKALAEYDQRQRDLEEAKAKGHMSGKAKPMTPHAPVAPGTFSGAKPSAEPADSNVKIKALLTALADIDIKRHHAGHDMFPTREKVYKQFSADALVRSIVTMSDYSQMAVETAYNRALDELEKPLPQVTQEQLDAEIAATSERDEGLTVVKSETPAPVGLPTSDSVKDWFPRVGDESISPDEPKHAQPANRWKNFWQQATEWGYTEREIHAKVFGGVNSMNDTGLEPNEAIRKLKEFHFAKPVATSTPAAPFCSQCKAADFDHCMDKMLCTNPNKPHSDKSAETSSPVAPEKAPEPPKIKTGVPIAVPAKDTPQIAPLSQKENHHMEAPVIAYTTIIINEHRVSVTAREGATAEQVHDTVIALIDGLRLIAADDTIKSYAAVVDGRDKTHTMKGDIKVVDAPHIPTAVSTVPSANGNDTAANDVGGRIACVAIEVGTTYTGGKPALKFNCDGYELPLQFAKQTGEMVKLLSKVKHGTAPFTAEDLTVGRKFGGAWIVAWKDAMGKDEKMHRNVIDVLPA